MARKIRPLTPAEEEAAAVEQALFERRILERAFLCYLLSRPSEMERFMGNGSMNEFFVESRHCCIYECMEEIFQRHGPLDAAQYLLFVAEELVEREKYEWVGGREYLADLACHIQFSPGFVWEFQTDQEYRKFLEEESS